MKNLEIKLKIDNFKVIRLALRRMKAVPRGTIRQTDTYFQVRHGRLKLRCINNAQYEFIYYERSNKGRSKLSTYERYALNKKQANVIHSVLGKSLGIKTVVVKKRELWIYKNTRIHLDTVGRLGSFIELETVMRHQTFPSAITEHKKVFTLLNLSTLPKIKYSYNDLLMRKSRA